MSYYKGNSILKNKVVKDYVKGIYERRVIPKGTNKYNYDFLLKVKTLVEDFALLIRVESCVISILREHVDSKYVYGTINNIYRLMTAQSGTIRWYKALAKSLKTYVIKEKKLYQNIKKDIEYTQDRYNRNNLLVMKYLDEYGFTPICNKIEELYHHTIYDDILEFSENFKVNLCDDDWDNKKEVYETLDKAYIERLCKIAENYNINLFNEVSQIVVDRYNIKQKQIKEIQAEQKELAYQKKKEESETAFDIIQTRINNAIDNAGNAYYSETVAKQLVFRLKEIGGKGFYITFVKNKRPYFYRQNIENLGTDSLLKMNLFKYDDNVGIQSAILNIKSKYKDAIIEAMAIRLPEMDGKLTEYKMLTPEERSKNLFEMAFEEEVLATIKIGGTDDILCHRLSKYDYMCKGIFIYEHDKVKAYTYEGTKSTYVYKVNLYTLQDKELLEQDYKNCLLKYGNNNVFIGNLYIEEQDRKAPITMDLYNRVKKEFKNYKDYKGSSIVVDFNMETLQLRLIAKNLTKQAKLVENCAFEDNEAQAILEAYKEKRKGVRTDKLSEYAVIKLE